MPAAIAIPLIIGAASAGTQVAAAKMGSNAAKNAAKTQAASGDKALALQQQTYAQQRQDFAPYQAAGNAAVAGLSQRAQQPVPSFNPGGPQPSFGGGLAQMSPQMPQQGPQMPSGGAMVPQGMGQPQGPMVLMQGPDGAKRQVPQHVASQLQQRGFQVIG